MSGWMRSALRFAAACIAGIGGAWALSKVMGWNFDFDPMISLSFLMVLAIIWLIVAA